MQMDDPDDPCWSWPYWKFGLRREDLFTKLHDQYNTIQSALLDPEAFHHDVCEISHEAASSDEFHRLLRNRKAQRIRELNESLESAAFEIIASPSLIGTEQWHHAVQLFRTKSLDSLVRYFASYLPQSHPWHRSAQSVSGSETSSNVDSVADSHGSIFDEPIMTDEPFEMETSNKCILPPSPRSMTMCSESSAASPMDLPHHDYELNTLTPPRTLSYSESEPDLHSQDGDASQPCDAASPATSVSTVPDCDEEDEADAVAATTKTEAEPTDSISASSTPDTFESETPTPKPERPAASFFEAKPSLPHRRHRSTSPSRPLPLSRCEAELHSALRDPRSSAHSLLSPRQRRMECMAVRRSSRLRCRKEISTWVQRQPSPDGISRVRPRGRRQFKV